MGQADGRHGNTWQLSGSLGQDMLQATPAAFFESELQALLACARTRPLPVPVYIGWLQVCV
jgi:hypothetical protein